MLTDRFAQKNLRRHGGIYNVYYYWHDSGSFNYWLDNSLTIWKCIFIARQADRRNISTEFYWLRMTIIELYVEGMDILGLD